MTYTSTRPFWESAEFYADFVNVEKNLIAQVKENSEKAPITFTPELMGTLSSKVDHSHLITFVREQGGYGCGMYSATACWDVMNEKLCPFSPNISVNRQLWAWSLELHGKIIHDPTGKPYSKMGDYFKGFGCPTEGSELTDSDAVHWPTKEGDLEAPMYRIDTATPVSVDVQEFKKWLAKGPLRVTIGGNHFVAFMGYDDATKKFKYLNSWGDRWGENGFGYVEYSKLSEKVQGAEFYTFTPPKSVPAARIKLTQEEGRQNVHMWLGIEGKTAAKKIWPSGQSHDISRKLEYTVMLPRGFVWPPESTNRLYLEILDTGGNYETGGKLEEFTAAFGGHVIKCSQLSTGPKIFDPHKLTRFTIP